MLVVFATRYDTITERTHSIARRLLARAADGQIPVVELFDANATCQELAKTLSQTIRVFAFYGHGDEDGKLLTQDREPCWAIDGIPRLAETAIVAHACRGMNWLAPQFESLGVRVVVGYEVDLYQPNDGSPLFWDSYEEIHSFIPPMLFHGVDIGKVRLAFYAFCTDLLHKLDARKAALIELISIMQSRDRLQIFPEA